MTLRKMRYMLPVLGLLALSAGCGPQYSSGDYDDFEKQTAKYWEQSEATDRQLELAERQLELADEQVGRYEQLLSKWEEQAVRQDAILTRQEELLRKQETAQSVE